MRDQIEKVVDLIAAGEHTVNTFDVDLGEWIFIQLADLESSVVHDVLLDQRKKAHLV